MSYRHGQCIECERVLTLTERKCNGYQCDRCKHIEARELLDYRMGAWALVQHPLDYGQTIQ